MTVVRLEEAREESAFGGKSVSLGAALRAGLRVPDRLALSVAAVEAVVAGLPGALEDIHSALEAARCPGAWAVRSSAVGEDSGGTSFAGQHLSRLNVYGAEGLREAIVAVRESGRTVSALAYRKRMGIPGEPKVAVAIQRMVRPDAAGVLFTRHPVTGADERLARRNWKSSPDGSGTRERAVEAERAGRFCLEAAALRELEGLARACEANFQGPSDIEFAFSAGTLYLLQRRPITR